MPGNDTPLSSTLLPPLSEVQSRLTQLAREQRELRALERLCYRRKDYAERDRASTGPRPGPGTAGQS